MTIVALKFTFSMLLIYSKMLLASILSLTNKLRRNNSFILINLLLLMTFSAFSKDFIDQNKEEGKVKTLLIEKKKVMDLQEHLKKGLVSRLKNNFMHKLRKNCKNSIIWKNSIVMQWRKKVQDNSIYKIFSLKKWVANLIIAIDLQAVQ